MRMNQTNKQYICNREILRLTSQQTLLRSYAGAFAEYYICRNNQTHSLVDRKTEITQVCKELSNIHTGVKE